MLNLFDVRSHLASGVMSSLSVDLSVAVEKYCHE